MINQYSHNILDIKQLIQFFNMYACTVKKSKDRTIKISNILHNYRNTSKISLLFKLNKFYAVIDGYG